MKNFLVLLAVLVATLVVAEAASAGGRHCHNGGGYRYYYRSSGFSRGGYSGGGGLGFGGGRHAGRVDPPVTIIKWDDDSLLNLGAQKFAELSGISDEEADTLSVAIKEKDYQTTKGVRVIEKVEFLAKWTVISKDQSGKEEKVPMSRVFKLKFDDYGDWKKYDD